MLTISSIELTAAVRCSVSGLGQRLVARPLIRGRNNLIGKGLMRQFTGNTPIVDAKHPWFQKRMLPTTKPLRLIWQNRSKWQNKPAEWWWTCVISGRLLPQTQTESKLRPLCYHPSSVKIRHEMCETRAYYLRFSEQHSGMVRKCGLFHTQIDRDTKSVHQHVFIRILNALKYLSALATPKKPFPFHVLSTWWPLVHRAQRSWQLLRSRCGQLAECQELGHLLVLQPWFPMASNSSCQKRAADIWGVWVKWNV